MRVDAERFVARGNGKRKERGSERASAQRGNIQREEEEEREAVEGRSPGFYSQELGR